MPVAHIYAEGALQECVPLGAKVYARFVERLAEIKDR